MWIINELITKYNTDPVVKRMVDGVSWHIFPGKEIIFKI
jgi:hypothetical protein